MTHKKEPANERNGLELTGDTLSECYQISQKATREALKEYDLSTLDRDNLHLDTIRNKASLVYKLYTISELGDKILIATTKVSTKTKKSSVKITALKQKN